MGTKNNPGPFDCYNNAEPDEPMFVLLARDKYAPALVSLWRVLRELDGEGTEKVKEANRCVLEMIKWSQNRGGKIVGLDQVLLSVAAEMEGADLCIKQHPFIVSADESNIDTMTRIFRKNFSAPPDDADKEDIV